MYQGKHGNHDRGRAPRRPRSKRTLLAALALVLVLGLAIGGTIAYLFTNTDPITNTFTPGETKPKIEEKFENNVKSEIKITNTGNVDAYIRVMLVGNKIALDDDGNEVKDGNGNNIVTGGFTPSFTLNGTDWIKIGDYYYYKTPVSASGQTNDLLGNGSTITVGKDETVTVLAQSIQAKPTSVVTETWKVSLDSNGNITGGSK